MMFYGGYIFYHNIMNNFNTIDIFTLIKYILIITTFLSVVYLYVIGYVMEKFSLRECIFVEKSAATEN